MKYKRTFFIFILALPVLVSCGGGEKPEPTNSYTVTFNPNGGQIVSGPSSIQVESGTLFSQCDVPIVTKDNKLFRYWAFDIEGSNKVGASYKITSNIEVYAYLVDEYHTITFDENGGSITGEKTRRVRDGTLFSQCDKPTATKDDYDFKYWTFDAVDEKTIDTNYVVENDFTVYAQYHETGTIYLGAPENSSIVSYGSTVVSYGDAQTSNITATSSDTSILTVELDEDRSCIYLDAANGNVEGTTTVTVSDGIKSDSVDIAVHHPRTTQEAGESFDFALGREVYNITLTFNFDNSDDLDTFFNDRMETRLSAPSIYNDYVWNTGTNKTNSVKLAPSDKMATKSSDIEVEHSEYYYKNLKNAAYELRRSKIQRRTGNHFAIDDAKKRLKVHNSETLFFALERGFRPEFDSSEIAVNGSVAERAYQVYQRAREACADAFGTETTDNLMKVRQLFEWLMDNTHYDHWIVSDAFTDTKFWEWTSFFAEGVFLNKGIAVCDGFSKALAIMGGIEGLPIIRSAGFATYVDEEGKPVTSGHAWNYYHHTDGNWYLICPTWAHDDNPGDQNFINYNFSIMSYQPFMTQSNYFYKHTHDMYYNYLIEKEHYSTSQAEAIASEIAAENDFKEVLFTDISKSSTPYVSDIYKTDIFDPTRDYDYHLDSKAEALALVNKITSLNLNSSFSVDISYYSGCAMVVNYFLEQLRNKYGGDNVSFLLEYTYTHVNVVVKI